jgi:hypothetical protein
MANAVLLNQYVRDNLAAIRDQCGCRLRRSGAAQSIPNNANTRIDLDTTDWDTLGTMADLTNDRITFPTGYGGKYTIGACLSWPANATGIRGIHLQYHDSTGNVDTEIARDEMEGFSSSVATHGVLTSFDCKAGDYIWMQGYQDSGGALNSNSNAAWSAVMFAVKEGF